MNDFIILVKYYRIYIKNKFKDTYANKPIHIIFPAILVIFAILVYLTISIGRIKSLEFNPNLHQLNQGLGVGLVMVINKIIILFPPLFIIFRHINNGILSKIQIYSVDYHYMISFNLLYFSNIVAIIFSLILALYTNYMMNIKLYSFIVFFIFVYITILLISIISLGLYNLLDSLLFKIITIRSSLIYDCALFVLALLIHSLLKNITFSQALNIGFAKILLILAGLSLLIIEINLKFAGLNNFEKIDVVRKGIVYFKGNGNYLNSYFYMIYDNGKVIAEYLLGIILLLIACNYIEIYIDEGLPSLINPFIMINFGLIEKKKQWYIQFNPRAINNEIKINLVFSTALGLIAYFILGEMNKVNIVAGLLSLTACIFIQALIRLKFDENQSNQISFIFIYSFISFLVYKLLGVLT